MRTYFFTKTQIDRARAALDRLPEEWLAAALALAARQGKTPIEAAKILKQAATGSESAWNTLRTEYGVMWHDITPPLLQTNRGHLDLSHERADTAKAALLAFLVEEYDLNEPSAEELLEARVAELERRVAALRGGAAPVTA
jgi:hypothetical protein